MTIIRVDNGGRKSKNRKPIHMELKKSSALDKQVGGDHYKDFVIQPVEYCTKNKLGFLQGCIIKRITRYNQPTGKGLEDLEKIKHEINLLIEIEGLNKELLYP